MRQVKITGECMGNKTMIINQKGKKSPFLSIVLTTYNRKHCISRMIDSILIQSFEDFELIIVDDGSTDETQEMLKKKYNDKRIQIIFQENRGVSSARNLGISLAKGEYITFVDSDDYLLNGFFEDIFQMLSSVEVDVVVYGGYLMDGKNKYPILTFFNDRASEYKQMKIKQGVDFLKDFCLLSGNSWGCAKVYNTNFIKKHRLGFDVNISYGEDMLFCMESYLYASKVMASIEKFYVYDICDVSISRGGLNAKQKIENLILTYKSMEDKFEKHYLALNCMRHISPWLMYCVFSLKHHEKEEISNLCQMISDDVCTIFEKKMFNLIKRQEYRKLYLLFVYIKLRHIYAKIKIIHPFTRPLIFALKYFIKRGKDIKIGDAK